MSILKLKTYQHVKGRVWRPNRGDNVYIEVYLVVHAYIKCSQVMQIFTYVVKIYIYCM